MGEAPSEYTVSAVSTDGKKVRVQGHGETAFSVSPSQPLSTGQVLKGWLNMEGKWGPWIKVAEDRQNGGGGKGGGGGRGKDGRSIERQVALKAAVESLPESAPTREVLERAQSYDDFLAASARPADTSSAPPADQPAANGADSEQATSDDIPF